MVFASYYLVMGWPLFLDASYYVRPIQDLIYNSGCPITSDRACVVAIILLAVMPCALKKIFSKSEVQGCLKCCCCFQYCCTNCESDDITITNQPTTSTSQSQNGKEDDITITTQPTTSTSQSQNGKKDNTKIITQQTTSTFQSQNGEKDNITITTQETTSTSHSQNGKKDNITITTQPTTSTSQSQNGKKEMWKRALLLFYPPRTTYTSNREFTNFTKKLYGFGNEDEVIGLVKDICKEEKESCSNSAQDEKHVATPVVLIHDDNFLSQRLNELKNRLFQRLSEYPVQFSRKFVFSIEHQIEQQIAEDFPGEAGEQNQNQVGKNVEEEIGNRSEKKTEQKDENSFLHQENEITIVIMNGEFNKFEGTEKSFVQKLTDYLNSGVWT